jgi:hypothetical protein
VIITTYRIEKISDDHPYIWRYTARRAPVIFDHPYNADYLRLSRPAETLWTLRQIFQFCASQPPALAVRALLYGRLTSSRGSRTRR